MQLFVDFETLTAPLLKLGSVISAGMMHHHESTGSPLIPEKHPSGWETPEATFPEICQNSALGFTLSLMEQHTHVRQEPGPRCTCSALYICKGPDCFQTIPHEEEEEWKETCSIISSRRKSLFSKGWKEMSISEHLLEQILDRRPDS
ncbi:unnamed protein product [Natator depressus]